MQVEQEDKEEYYETLNQTVEELNETLPALIKDKLDLKSDLKSSREQATFMRHEMATIKQKHQAQLALREANFDREVVRLEQKRIDMGKMLEAEIQNYLQVIVGKDKRVDMLL